MSSDFGTKVKISIFGQSHSQAVGVVINGLPAGINIDMDKVLAFMSRRAPGKNDYSTKRSEKDIPEILGGIVGDKTCGAPICAVIKNEDIKSGDYDNIKNIPRPSHADFPAYVKYNGFNDIRGGGHFSARLTAPLCFAGAVCLNILEQRGIHIGAHISSIMNIEDKPFDPVYAAVKDIEYVQSLEFPVIEQEKAAPMLAAIRDAKNSGDSVGGTVECCILGLPAGLGEPIFDGIENKISCVVFGIPAVKGIEFGAGFDSQLMLGSENNDEYHIENGKVRTKTNNAGGILGGLSTGMPLIFKAAFKPTPSIAKQQASVNLIEQTNTDLIINGRHDPCIVPRAVPCVEAAAAIAVLDLLYLGGF